MALTSSVTCNKTGFIHCKHVDINTGCHLLLSPVACRPAPLKLAVHLEELDAELLLLHHHRLEAAEQLGQHLVKPVPLLPGVQHHGALPAEQERAARHTDLAALLDVSHVLTCPHTGH